jgi:hypothetical protein
LEDCSKETDGEIVSVYIQGFRKLRDAQDGTKVYVSQYLLIALTLFAF